MSPHHSIERTAHVLQGIGNYEKRLLGADHDFGESTVLKCKRWGRYWLYCLIEYEYLTTSGRWFLGPIANLLQLGPRPRLLYVILLHRLDYKMMKFVISFGGNG